MLITQFEKKNVKLKRNINYKGTKTKKILNVA